MRKSWFKLLVLALATTLVAAACSDDAKTEGPDTQNPPTVTDQAGLAPAFESNQTWTVAVSYRSQGIRTNELFKALTDELADPTPVAEALPFVPSEVVPPSDESWSGPVFWTFGVVTTDYRPESDNDFYAYALDQAGEVQPITIVKVVADKDLNTSDIADTLDPTFYMVIRESDMRVRGVHYNYKVRDGRNTVVLEMPENDSGMASPGADQPFFLVPYMMPAFPLDNTTTEVKEIALADGGNQTVTPDGTAAIAEFDISFDESRISQRWAEGEPWYQWSSTHNQRAWRLTPEQVVELGGSATTTDTGFLEPAEAISAKFRNPIDIRRAATVEAGPIAASAPPSHIPWSGDYWSLKRGSAIFGWDSFSSGRESLTDGPASQLRETLREQMVTVDELMDEVLDIKDRDSDEFKTKRDEYWEKKREVQTKIDAHFDGLQAQYQSGDAAFDADAIQNFGPLEKFDLYVMANKLGNSSYKPWGASRWEMANQYNPGGPGWWGHCNGWAAAAILTEQPTEPISVSINLENITGEDRELTLDFAAGDLKALSSLSYYTGYSHFYGERYNGEEQDIDDLHPHVFHRILTHYIGTEKYPFVMDTTKDEEVWNFPAYAYDGEIVELTDFEGVEDKPEYKKAFDVTMTVTFGTDSVDEEYIAEDLENQEVFTQEYAYRLYTDDDNEAIGGEWVSDNHPDFAWVPYGNNTTFGWRSNENPQLQVDIVEQLFSKRENAPQVCDAAANAGAGDCPGDLACDAVNGTCVEAVAGGGACAGAPAIEGAQPLDPGLSDGLAVCSNVKSTFAIALVSGDTLTATATFRHADGDIDVSLLDDQGTRLASSTSTSDEERIEFAAQADRTVYLQVYGYNGDANTVAVNLDIESAQPTGCMEEGAEFVDNDTFADAKAVSGTLEGAICGEDSDFFLVEGSGEGKVRIAFEHAVGDLDLAIVDEGGRSVSVSQSTEDMEEVSGTLPFVVRVYGYNGATAPYTLTAE